jgi:hypothetical protein
MIMATLLRAQNAAMLLKLESSEGVFNTPSSSTDGILVENPDVSYNPQNVETDEVTGSLDSRGPIVGGMQCSITFDVYLKGNGNPGVAPEWDEAMQVSSWAPVATKTDITGTTFAVTGAANITDSGSGMAALTIGTVLYTSGFVNAANNGEFLVSASAAGSITLTKLDGSAPALVNEVAGPTVTLRRGIAGVAATAGATTGFTAQAPWGNTDQIYRGMPVLLSGNPATAAWSVIADYLATRVALITDLMGVALSASTKLSIPANVLYKPISSAIPSGSIEFYLDGVKYQFAGCRGSVRFSCPAGGACKASFSLTGMYINKLDAAVPAVTYDGTRPGIWRASKFLLNRLATALKTLNLDTGAQTQYPADPNQSEGFSSPQITGRSMSGDMDPYATLIATRDIMAAFRAGVQAIINAVLIGGNASNPGQRISVLVPKAQYTSYKPGKDGKLATEQVGFFPFGQDAGAYICIY